MIYGALTLTLQVPAAPPAKLQTAWYLAAWTLGTSDTCTFGLHPTTTILQRIRQPAICAFQARSAKRVDGVLRIYANATHAASRWRAVITRLKVCMVGGWSRSTTEQYSVRSTEEDGLRTTVLRLLQFWLCWYACPKRHPHGQKHAALSSMPVHLLTSTGCLDPILLFPAWFYRMLLPVPPPWGF